MTGPADESRRLAVRLFLTSFIALFLELMIIRWAPSVVRLVAYYANLMLISSFLGLGAGAIAARVRARFFGWFPVLLAAEIALLFLLREQALPGSDVEQRFFGVAPRWTGYLMLVGIFVSNALTFVPLGQQVGLLFQALPPLRAYAWDLGGSLSGTIAFGVFSFTRFSPVAGMAAVMAVFLALAGRRTRLWSAPLFVALLAWVWAAQDPTTIWSPYHHITVEEEGRAGPADLTAAGRAGLDPPTYVARVNQHFYQHHGSIDPARYTPGTVRAGLIGAVREQYVLPYLLSPGRARVVVLGAGGGVDVEGALLSGVERVDAVEIDPALVQLCRRLNPAKVYDDPRVRVHIDDARAFLERAARDRGGRGPGYDHVVYGYLDSQALFSSMTSLRLDGYTYTVEGIRAGYEVLGEDGLLSLSFVAPQDWLVLKLIRMVREATGREPVVYAHARQVVVCASRKKVADPPESLGRFQRIALEPGEVDVPTDDWPYLYLSRKTIPSDYLIVIGLLLALSMASLLALRGGGLGADDGHFLMLGLGFLLLQTRSIGDCSLYFGTTWLVTTLVVTGVLVMVLAANAVAARMRRFSPVLYLPLFAALLLLYVVPRQSVLGLPLGGRLLWTLLVVPLPVFFAGLIFSTTFREAAQPAALFGSNLIGAVIGGFGEYVGMAAGNRVLLLIVIAAYAGSLVFRAAAGRRRVGQTTAGA